MDCISFFFSSRRRHTRCSRDWSSDVCSTDLRQEQPADHLQPAQAAGGQDRRRCRPPAAARKPGSDPLDGVGPRDAVPLAGPRARRFPAIRPGAGSAALPLLQRGRPCPLPCRARRDRLRGRSGGALRVDHQRAGCECAEARVSWRPPRRDLRAQEPGAGSVPALRRGRRDRLSRRPGLPPDRDTRPSARAHIDRADRCALENAQLYQAAREAIAVRDEFLSVASHELRTPLTSMLLSVQGLERVVLRSEDERLRERTGRVAHQLSRLIKLVDSLLDVSRIAAGRMELSTEEFDLGALAREDAARFMETARGNGSALEVRAPDRLVGVWDPMRVDQVLTNLLSNAVKFLLRNASDSMTVFGAGKPIELAVQGDDAAVKL